MKDTAEPDGWSMLYQSSEVLIGIAGTACRVIVVLRVYNGAVDGVDVRVGAVVTKKDLCLYDGLYIASPAVFDDGWGTFVQMLSDFKTKD